ncbi:MAG: hypothetical protein CXT78_12535 [Thaumarchaeota archaeon]|nr:MAG: hypothetical protein CXT78_12535 [Nitrososphaerota archaeon]
MIEVDHYDIICPLMTLTEQIIVEKSIKNSIFWHNATKYASTSSDESFVEEVAYMMVTLHRTCA